MTALSVSPAGVLADRDVLAATTAPASPANRERDRLLLLATLLTRHAHVELPIPSGRELTQAAEDVTYSLVAVQRCEPTGHDGPCWPIPSGEGCSNCQSVYECALDNALDHMGDVLDRIDLSPADLAALARWAA